MRCRNPNCGHEGNMHTDTGCRIRVLTGWKEAEQTFTGEHPCPCKGYAEPYNAAAHSDCPHETCKDNPRCVICGALVSENVT